MTINWLLGKCFVLFRSQIVLVVWSFPSESCCLQPIIAVLCLLIAGGFVASSQVFWWRVVALLWVSDWLVISSTASPKCQPSSLDVAKYFSFFASLIALTRVLVYQHTSFLSPVPCMDSFGAFACRHFHSYFFQTDSSICITHPYWVIMRCLDSVNSTPQFLFIWINFSHFCQLECPWEPNLNHKDITSDWRWRIKYFIGRRENHLKMKAIRTHQHGFMKGKSCLTNLIAFDDEMTVLVDEGRAGNVLYLKQGVLPSRGIFSTYINMCRKELKNREPGFSRWCPVDTNWNKIMYLFKSSLFIYELWGWSDTGTGCTRRLWSPQLWRCSNHSQPWATCCRWPRFKGVVWTRCSLDITSNLNYSLIL